MADVSDEVAHLRRVIENQDEALAHWRKCVDEGAAELAAEREKATSVRKGLEAIDNALSVVLAALEPKEPGL